MDKIFSLLHRTMLHLSIILSVNLSAKPSAFQNQACLPLCLTLDLSDDFFDLSDPKNLRCQISQICQSDFKTDFKEFMYYLFTTFKPFCLLFFRALYFFLLQILSSNQRMLQKRILIPIKVLGSQKIKGGPKK